MKIKPIIKKLSVTDDRICIADKDSHRWGENKTYEVEIVLSQKDTCEAFDENAIMGGEAYLECSEFKGYFIIHSIEYCVDGTIKASLTSTGKVEFMRRKLTWWVRLWDWLREVL